MRRLFLILMLTGSLSVMAQYECQWLQAINGDGLERTWDLQVDADDGVIVGGQFSGELLIGDMEMNSNGLSDSFVARFTAQGDLDWVYTFGGIGDDIVLSAEADADGNVYCAGYFDDTLTMLGQEYTAIGWEAMVLKIDNTGNPEWFYTPTCSGSDIAHGIAVHDDGTVYFAGWYQEKITLNDEITLDFYGSSDILLVSLTADGEVRWGRHMGNEEVNYGYTIECDNDGNPYIAGVASKNAVFDTITTDRDGAYVAKYSTDGEVQYVAHIGECGIYGIEIDDQNQMAVAAYTYGQDTQLDDIFIENTTGTNDIFFARTDAEGNWIDALSLSGTGSDKISKLEFAHDGSVFYSGAFSDTLSIMGEQVVALRDDVLLAKLNPQWELEWYQVVGGEYSEKSYGIGVDSEDAVYITCWIEDELTVGDFTITSGGVGNAGSAIMKFASTVGIEENEMDTFQTVIYPNPVTDGLTIRSEKVENFTCKVQNMEGRVVMDVEMVSGQKIDMQSLVSGPYIISLFVDNQFVESFKIIKK